MEIADFFEVDVRTIYRWKNAIPEFCQALKVGKEEADNRVKRSLFQRAVGFEHDAVKIFCQEGQAVTVPYREYVVPDTTAGIFWLKNRMPEEFRDRAPGESAENPLHLKVSREEALAKLIGAGAAPQSTEPQV